MYFIEMTLAVYHDNTLLLIVIVIVIVLTSLWIVI